ncbi:hypothetical protein D3C84_1258000 [compost metagenome]
MNTKPCSVMGSPHSYTPFSELLPPLAAAPRDFSKMVVRPPALLPGEGLLFSSAPLMRV